MKLSYTRRAARQVEAILSHVAARSPSGAANLFDRIEEVEIVLRQYPMIGRATSVRGIRRIAIIPCPYVLDYRRVGDEVIVQRVRHTSRRPLP